jgi:2-methylcitrate dehydratase PrpD
VPAYLDPDNSPKEPEAAFLNSAVLHYLDFYDTVGFSQGHRNVAINPAILAVAEPRGMSLESMILAYAVGPETLTRLSRVLPMLHLKRWHPTSLLSGIAASAASSKFLCIDIERTAASMSPAASMAHGLAVRLWEFSRIPPSGKVMR